MKWISRQNRNSWFWFCVLTWFQILAAVLSAWISCPLLATFSGFPTWGSWPGIPCRRSSGFQGSIGVLLVAYHTFKKIFRTYYFRFLHSKPEVIGPVWCDIEWINAVFPETNFSQENLLIQRRRGSTVSAVLVQKNNRPLQVELENGRSWLQNNFQIWKSRWEAS